MNNEAVAVVQRLFCLTFKMTVKALWDFMLRTNIGEHYFRAIFSSFLPAIVFFWNMFLLKWFHTNLLKISICSEWRVTIFKIRAVIASCELLGLNQTMWKKKKSTRIEEQNTYIYIYISQLVFLWKREISCEELSWAKTWNNSSTNENIYKRVFEWNIDENRMQKSQKIQ